MKKKLAILILLLALDSAFGVEFEPLLQSVSKALGTTKAKKYNAQAGTKTELYYSVDSSGKADKLAFVEKGIYEPNCTHTWVIGVDAKTSKVTQIRVVEMSCPHAFPTKEAAFLDQYKGKTPADLKKLDSSVATIAKATGSCVLTTDAVKRTLTMVTKLKGKI